MLLLALLLSSFRHDTPPTSALRGSQAETVSKGHESTSRAVHRRCVLPAAIAGVRCRERCATSLPPRSRGCTSAPRISSWSISLLAPITFLSQNRQHLSLLLALRSAILVLRNSQMAGKQVEAALLFTHVCKILSRLFAYEKPVSGVGERSTEYPQTAVPA